MHNRTCLLKRWCSTVASGPGQHVLCSYCIFQVYVFKTNVVERRHESCMVSWPRSEYSLLLSAIQREAKNFMSSFWKSKNRRKNSVSMFNCFFSHHKFKPFSNEFPFHSLQICCLNLFSTWVALPLPTCPMRLVNLTLPLFTQNTVVQSFRQGLDLLWSFIPHVILTVLTSIRQPE